MNKRRKIEKVGMEKEGEPTGEEAFKEEGRPRKRGSWFSGRCSGGRSRREWRVVELKWSGGK